MPYNFGKVVASKGRSSNQTMLLNWLESNSNFTGMFEFNSAVIQTELPKYFKVNYDKLVTPDTISRLWRKLREELKTDKHSSLLYARGIKIEEFSKSGSTQKHYRIIRWKNQNEVPRL